MKNCTGTDLQLAASIILMSSDVDIAFETTVPDRVPSPKKEGEVEPDFTADRVITINDETYDNDTNVSITIDGKTYTEHKENTQLRYAIDTILCGRELSNIQHMTTEQKIVYVKSRAIVCQAYAAEKYYMGCLYGNEAYRVGDQIFVSAVDTFLHLANLFKTYIFSGFGLRDFKRSELRAFLENHMLRWELVKNLQYGDIAHIVLPMPKQCACKKLSEPHKEIASFLTEINMPAKVSELFSTVKKLKDGKYSSITLPNDNNKLLLSNCAVVDKWYKRSPYKDSVPFSEIYGSVSEFVNTINMIAEGDVFFREVSGIQSTVAKIDKIFASIKPETIPNEVSAIISKQCRVVAELLTAYGNAISIMDITDHHAAMHADIIMNNYDV